MTTDHDARSQRPPAIRETIVLALACLSYSILSFLAKAPESVAVAHAHDVAAFELRFGLFIEGPTNAWLTTHPLLASLASTQYAVSFFAMTGFAMIVLWLKAPTHYRSARWTLVIMTIGALVTYWTYPLAPPRLVDGEELPEDHPLSPANITQMRGSFLDPVTKFLPSKERS